MLDIRERLGGRACLRLAKVQKDLARIRRAYATYHGSEVVGGTEHPRLRFRVGGSPGRQLKAPHPLGGVANCNDEVLFDSRGISRSARKRHLDASAAAVDGSTRMAACFRASRFTRNARFADV